MSNFMMFWRSADLDSVIRHNAVAGRPARNRRHLACADHSPAELAAFERSLHREVAATARPHGPRPRLVTH